jgi:hypothetical protein
MAGASILGRTGLDKILGLGIIGLAGAETAKYGLINPLLERTGVKPPSYVPPPAMSQYEEIMLGQQERPGFLGFGGQQRTRGLIERRADFDMDQQRNSQVMNDRIMRMQIGANSPLELTRVLADRDKHSATQGALASMSAAMANSMTGNQSAASQIGYSQTGYAPQYNGPMNYSAAAAATGQMRGRGRGRGSRYGVDMSSQLPPGAPMTPDLREQMQYSQDQMGQFSGRGGAIARGYDSAKYGYIDNMVPGGAEGYALGYGPTGGRRRGRRG